MRVFQHWGTGLLRLALFLAAVGYLFQRTDKEVLIALLAGLNPIALIPLVLTSFGVLILLALRWFVICYWLQLRLDFGRAFSLLWLSQALGELGPPMLVGEGLRFLGLKGRGTALGRGISQAIDRLSGIFALSGLLLFDVAWFRHESPVPLERVNPVIAGIVLILLAAWGLQRSKGVFTPPELREGLRLLLGSRSVLHYALSVLIQLALVLNLYWAGKAVDAEVSPAQMFGAGLWILAATTFLPGLLSDWGKREMAVVMLLGGAGVAESKALALSLLYGAAHFLVALPGFLVPLWLSFEESG